MEERVRTMEDVLERLRDSAGEQDDVNVNRDEERKTRNNIQKREKEYRGKWKGLWSGGWR